MKSFYRLSIVTMSLSGYNILNAILLPAAIIHVHRITVSYLSFDCSVRHSSITIVCMGLQSLWEIAFFPQPDVRCWHSDIGNMVGPP